MRAKSFLKAKENLMRNGRFLLAVALTMVGLCAMAGTATAQTNYSWDAGGATDANWTQALNWNSDTVPVNDPNGGKVTLNNGTFTDMNGLATDLSNMRVEFFKQGFTLADTPGTGSITCDIFHVQNYGASFYPAIICDTLQATYRVAGIKYYDTVDANTINLYSGQHYFYSDTTADVEVKVWDGANGDGIMYMRADGGSPVPSLTTPKITVDGPPSLFSAEGLVDVGTVDVLNGAKYIAIGNNSIGDASTVVTLSQGGFLELKQAQAAFPTINLGGDYNVLVGAMTGADYTPTTGNVALVANTIFASSDAVDPTRADLGGDATLYQAVTNGNKVVTVGDNETDAIFKAAAVGAFFGAGQMDNASFTAEPGSGNLQILYVGTGCPETRNNNKYFGDANRTADIKVVNGALIRLTQSFNQDYDYVADTDPTRINTFNISGEVGKESTTILDHYRTNSTHIKEGQTWNISNGKWNPGTYFAGKGQHGDLTLTDGIVGQPGTAYSASDSGFTMTLGGTFILEAHTASTHGYYEALDANFSYSGKPIITITDGQNYDIDYDGVGLNPIPIMADLMQNADISSATYKAVNFVGDLRIGHDKYLYNGLYRIDDHAGVTTGTGAQIIPAGNQPGGETAIIGIAATALGSGNNIDIDMEINGPDAIVRIGTTDPDRIVVANSGGFVAAIPTGTVIFHKTVAAQEIQVQSGSLQILAGASLDSGVAASFPVNFDTVTTTGTLRLSGSDLDDLNPVTITANSGGNLQIDSNLDLADTTVIANAGLTKVTIGGNGSTVILGNLKMNTQVAFGSNNSTGNLDIVGTLSGTGAFVTGNNKATVTSTGTVAPGDGVGELNKGGRIIRMADGAAYDWEIADPDATAGTGWDILWGSDLDFDVDDDEAGDLTINVIDAGLTRDIVATESFAIMAVTGNFDIPATWNVTISGAGFGGTGSLVYDETQDIDGDAVADKAYYLTGITRSLALIGDADDNGVVNAADYIILKSNIGTGTGMTVADGDFDDDGDVDWNDLQLLQANYGAGGAGASGVIPEPATLGLLAFGAMALIRRRRA